MSKKKKYRKLDLKHLIPKVKSLEFDISQLIDEHFWDLV